MRYAIGYMKKNKQKNTIDCHGIYAYGDFFLPALLSFDTEKVKEDRFKRTFIPVFTLEEGKKAVKILSNAYRRDDVAFNKKIKSRFIRNFYLIKVDSSKFPYALEDINKENHMENKRLQLKATGQYYCIKAIK